MRVAAMQTSGFRNLADARLELAAGISVLHGPNGAGKTNVLEAIHFGLTGGSFRTGNERDLIAFERASARVELELADGGSLLAARDRAGERRHALDGRRLSPAEHRAPVSVFHPARMELVKGPPAKRRAHLDRVVAALWPARGDLRGRFGRTLAQRNALAARVRAGQAGSGSLATWDERLAAEAVPLISSREQAVAVLREPLLAAADSLGLERVEIRYRPRAEADATAIASELERRRGGELGRAYLSYGPQLDEVELRVADRPLRRFGSQGQQRVALLALLFGEREALIAADRPPPLMLLDDVMSELDPDRRRRLVEALAGAGQALITATDARQVPAASELRRLAVRAGRALATAGANPDASTGDASEPDVSEPDPSEPGASEAA